MTEDYSFNYFTTLAEVEAYDKETFFDKLAEIGIKWFNNDAANVTRSVNELDNATPNLLLTTKRSEIVGPILILGIASNGDMDNETKLVAEAFIDKAVELYAANVAYFDGIVNPTAVALDVSKFNDKELKTLFKHLDALGVLWRSGDPAGSLISEMDARKSEHIYIVHGYSNVARLMSLRQADIDRSVDRSPINVVTDTDDFILQVSENGNKISRDGVEALLQMYRTFWRVSILDPIEHVRRLVGGK